MGTLGEMFIMKKFEKLITPFNVFVFVNVIGFLMYAVYSVIAGGIASDWLLMENTDLDFCDFSMHLNFIADKENLYVRARDYEGCFPPLSYTMYFFFYRVLQRPGFTPNSVSDVAHMPYFHLTVLYYSLISIMLFDYGIYMYGEKEKRKNLILFLCFIFSVPFMAGAIFVANSTFLVMIFLLIALKLRKSDTAYKKELALVLIALCAGFKIYPAVFGILYLLEKRYKEAIRLTIYGILFFFVPFTFFGGTNGFKHWLGNVMNTLVLDRYGRIQSIRGLLYSVMQHQGIQGGELILKLAPIVFVLVMLLLVCITKSEFRRLFFICAIMVFFPNNAYRYTLCYFAIPIITYFLDTDGEESSSNVIMCVEMFVYSMVFAIPVVFGILTGFELTFPYYTLTYVEIYIYIWAYILLAFITIHELVVKLKNQ